MCENAPSNPAAALRMKNGNLVILVLCQLISATGSIVFVTLGGIIGSTLTSNPAWATLPVSMMVISVAATTVPATILMRKVGRSKGFAMASLSAVVAVLVASKALSSSSFGLFNYLGEGFWMVDGHVGQRFAVKVNVSLFEAVNETAIGKTI